MTALHEPSLSLLLLFRERREAEHLEIALVKHLGLSQEPGQRAEPRYRGASQDGPTCQMQMTVAHDTLLVRCDWTLEGEYPPVEAWARLRQRGDALLNLFHVSGDAFPWAATWLFHAALPLGLTPDSLPDLFAAFSPSAPNLAESNLEATPYGWFGLLREEERLLAPPSVCWERLLLLVIPAERIEKVRRYFLAPLKQGWARIERHLHKAAYHARLQQEISQMLGEDTLRLRAQMTEAISTVDFAQIHRESRELERVSVSLMTFLNQKAHAEMVLQSLRVNLHDFILALEEVKLSTPLYEREKERLKQHIEQLQSDLEYARASTESAYAFQEMQRGIENNRLQRASLMLTTASALLAGFTIFNSFLDIWALVLADSPWHLPPMALRMALGALAGVSLPAAAYMAIERRYKPLFLWGTLSVLSLLLAILSTVWVNQ